MPILPSHRKYLHGHFHSFLNPSIKHHQRLSTLLSPNSTANVAGRTLGYRKMPPTSGGYILAKRSSHMISFVDSMLNILARMIFQLIPPPGSTRLSGNHQLSLQHPSILTSGRPSGTTFRTRLCCNKPSGTTKTVCQPPPASVDRQRRPSPYQLQKRYQGETRMEDDQTSPKTGPMQSTLECVEGEHA